MFEEARSGTPRLPSCSGFSTEPALPGPGLFGIRSVGAQGCSQGSQVCFDGKRDSFSQPSANSLKEMCLIADGYMSLSEGILQSKQPTADALFACGFGASASIH